MRAHEETLTIFRINEFVTEKSQALRNVLSLSEAEKIARKVVTMAKLGDLHAVNIIADRLDGKPHQSLDIADERSTVPNRSMARLSVGLFDKDF